MRHQQGFTILEILVAFVIATLAIGTLMQIFSTGMRNVSVTGDYARATELARSQLARVGADIPIREGELSGEFDHRYRWQLLLQRMDQTLEPDPVQLALSANLQASALPISQTGQATAELYQLTARVEWGGGEGVREPLRSIVLTSARFNMPNPLEQNP